MSGGNGGKIEGKAKHVVGWPQYTSDEMQSASGQEIHCGHVSGFALLLQPGDGM